VAAWATQREPRWGNFIAGVGGTERRARADEDICLPAVFSKAF